jgi:hypothetical protein
MTFSPSLRTVLVTMRKGFPTIDPKGKVQYDLQTSRAAPEKVE